jgi:uncharacterized protein (DUF1697 family)
MPVFIGLLRAVNVGGRSLKMQDLREVCMACELQNVHTYLQSGNVLFKATERKPKTVASILEAALERKLGFRPDVILRTTDELRTVISKNPFAKRRDIAPNKLHVLFLADELGENTRKALLALESDGEELRCGGRELYIYFPEGIGRSRFMPRVSRLLKNSATARNWNTVTKLLELADQL